MDWSISHLLDNPNSMTSSSVARILAIVVASVTLCLLSSKHFPDKQISMEGVGYSKGGEEGAMAVKPPRTSPGGHSRAQITNTVSHCLLSAKVKTGLRGWFWCVFSPPQFWERGMRTPGMSS